MRLEFAGRIVALALLATLAGCHPFRTLSKLGGSCHDVKPYLNAKSVPPLQVPPGLEPADTSSALRIPKLNEPEPPRRGEKDPCLDEPPPFATPKKPVPQARSIMPRPKGGDRFGLEAVEIVPLTA